jgi:hypothetical protein
MHPINAILLLFAANLCHMDPLNGMYAASYAYAHPTTLPLSFATAPALPATDPD